MHEWCPYSTYHLVYHRHSHFIIIHVNNNNNRWWWWWWDQLLLLLVLVLLLIRWLDRWVWKGEGGTRTSDISFGNQSSSSTRSIIECIHTLEYRTWWRWRMTMKADEGGGTVIVDDNNSCSSEWVEGERNLCCGSCCCCCCSSSMCVVCLAYYVDVGFVSFLFYLFPYLRGFLLLLIRWLDRWVWKGEGGTRTSDISFGNQSSSSTRSIIECIHTLEYRTWWRWRMTMKADEGGGTVIVDDNNSCSSEWVEGERNLCCGSCCCCCCSSSMCVVCLAYYVDVGFVSFLFYLFPYLRGFLLLLLLSRRLIFLLLFLSCCCCCCSCCCLAVCGMNLVSN